MCGSSRGIGGHIAGATDVFAHRCVRVFVTLLGCNCSGAQPLCSVHCNSSTAGSCAAHSIPLSGRLGFSQSRKLAQETMSGEDEQLLMPARAPCELEEAESSLDAMETDSSIDPDDAMETDIAEVGRSARPPRKDLRFKYLRRTDPTLFEEVKWLSRGDFFQSWHQSRFPEDARDSRISEEEVGERIDKSEYPYLTDADCHAILLQYGLRVEECRCPDYKESFAHCIVEWLYSEQFLRQKVDVWKWYIGLMDNT